MRTVAVRRALPWAVSGPVLVLLVAVVVVLQRMGDSWTGGEVDEEVVEALQAELRVVPGVDGAEVDYANDWKIQGRLSVAVTVEPGTDLDRITAQSERLAWQSAAVIEVVDVTVRWPRDLEGTPERSQSRHAADCAALLDARDCRPLTVLRDRYGSRPD